ncbi:MAG: OprD family porin [Campylobacteraceae bacterium]|nr:OprD family porin [Campylobacteraceae bacterium]
MKILKGVFLLVSAAAISNAADSLADALKNGSVEGELRSYYFNQRTCCGDKADILDFAVRLNYVTDLYYGFNAGVTFQGVSSPFADNDAKHVFGASNSLYGPGAVWSEAYISYTLGKNTLKAGRQFIDMPLIKSGSGKAVIQSFEGITLTSNEISGNTFYAGYIEKFQKQTDGKGGAPKFTKLDGSYAYALGVKNNYFEKLNLIGAYGGIKDAFWMLYMQADFNDAISSSFNYQTAVQYSHTDYESSADDSNYYGVKLGTGFGGFNMYAALAYVMDGDSRFGVVGGGSSCTLFTSSYEQCAEYEKSKQYAVDANYTFKDLGLLFGFRYANLDYEDIDDEIAWKSVYASYSPKGVFKGVSIKFVYENENHEKSKDTNLYIVRAAYGF